MPVTTITYSGGTLDLMDGTNYLVQSEGWNPAVTYLRDSDFGGVSDYADVDETLTIGVNGANAAARYQNLRNLQRAMDEATRWSRGEQLNAVLLNYQPDGGSGVTVSSVITGRPRGGENPFGISDMYAGGHGIIGDTGMRFRRRGLWLRTEDSVAATAAASNRVMTVSSFTTHPIASPCRVTLTNVSTTGNQPSDFGYFLWASGASVLSSSSVTSGTAFSGPWSLVAETQAFAANVRRFTPTATIEGSFVMDSTPIPSNIRTSNLVHVFINVRVNAASSPVSVLTIRARANLLDGTLIDGTPLALPATGATYALYLGAFPVAGRLDKFDVFVGVPAPTTSATYDIDAMAFLGDNDSYARILSLRVPAPSAGTLNIDHQLLTKPEPTVFHGTTTGVAWQGDAVLSMTGTTASGLFFSVGPGNKFSNSLATTHVMTVFRRRAYLLPE